jgi:sensor domain CHASE-containing protein
MFLLKKSVSPFMDDLRLAIPVIVLPIVCGVTLLVLVTVFVIHRMAISREARVQRQVKADTEAMNHYLFDGDVNTSGAMIVRDNEASQTARIVWD